MRVRSIIQDSRTWLLLSIIFGLLLPQLADITQAYLVPVLVVMMTLMLKDIKLHHVTGQQLSSVFKLVALNSVVLSTIYVFAAFFILEPTFQPAIILLGLMPPAVGIITLTYLLKGDMRVGFLAELLGYVISLLIIPVGVSVFFGAGITPFKVFETLFLLIVLPFVLSRGLHSAENTWRPIPKSFKKFAINVLYAFTFYIVIGVNQAKLITEWQALIPVFVLLVSIRFGLSTAVYVFARDKVRKPIDVLYTLFATFKNGGAAVGFTVLLFGVSATLPLAVNSVVVALHIIFLEWLVLGSPDDYIQDL